MIRTALCCLLCLITTSFAEHGGTAALEDSNQEARKKIAGKILNESMPVLWSKDGESALFHYEIKAGNREWRLVDLETGNISPVEKRPENFEPSPRHAWKSKKGAPTEFRKNNRQSPDKKLEVQFKEGAVFLDDSEIQLTIAEDSEWDTGRVLWAPDSSRFVIFKRTKESVREVHYVESSPKDQVQPKHSVIRYPKPGDQLNIGYPVVVFADGRDPIEVQAAQVKDPFDLRKFAWRMDSKRLVFEFIERGFGSLKLLEINTETNAQRALIDETDEKFVFVFGNTFRRDLKGGDEILWLSERDGWNHLYLVDGLSGKVIRQVTKGDWIVREVMDVDEANRSAMIRISGFHKGQDPYHLHLARVNLDTAELIPLTEGDGTHDYHGSLKGAYFYDRWSRVDQPPVHEIRRSSDGKLIASLATATGIDELVKTGWQKPERFVAKDRNNEFDIHGFILRPPNLDPKKKYPVIEAIYAGPHGSFTPKKWSTRHGGMAEMADAGFIVVKLDALGTNHRGKKFQQVAYKNLIDSGFPDRRKWITEAAKKVPQMDLERVGIYGGSAGGQSTLAALLTHPDFYKAGAADCGCHDNRMDKIWWNEQWMDWPIGPHYAANSNVTHAAKLEGNLLLTVGELDKNVDPSSTMQVVNALINADKDFEFIIVPSAGHGVGEKPYMRRKRIEFFQRHLGGSRKLDDTDE